MRKRKFPYAALRFCRSVIQIPCGKARIFFDRFEIAPVFCTRIEHAVLHHQLLSRHTSDALYKRIGLRHTVRIFIEIYRHKGEKINELARNGFHFRFSVHAVMRISEHDDIAPLVGFKRRDADVGKRKLRTAGRFENDDTIADEELGHHRFRRNHIQLHDKNLNEQNHKDGLHERIRPIEDFEGGACKASRFYGRIFFAVFFPFERQSIYALFVQKIQRRKRRNEDNAPQRNRRSIVPKRCSVFSGPSKHKRCEEHVRQILHHLTHDGNSGCRSALEQYRFVKDDRRKHGRNRKSRNRYVDGKRNAKKRKEKRSCKRGKQRNKQCSGFCFCHNASIAKIAPLVYTRSIRSRKYTL